MPCRYDYQIISLTSINGLGVAGRHFNACHLLDALLIIRGLYSAFALLPTLCHNLQKRTGKAAVTARKDAV